MRLSCWSCLTSILTLFQNQILTARIFVVRCKYLNPELSLQRSGDNTTLFWPSFSHSLCSHTSGSHFHHAVRVQGLCLKVVILARFVGN